MCSRVTALCEQLFPGKGNRLAQTWRFKQLQYSLMRSLMRRHCDFWGLTENGLVWASKNDRVDLTARQKAAADGRLLEALHIRGRSGSTTAVSESLDHLVGTEQQR